MINGAHLLLYSHDPEADRAVLRDMLGFPSVDAGHGWLIFALPAAEAAVHPAGGEAPVEHGGRGIVPTALYLMCDDLRAAIDHLAANGVRCGEVDEAPWGVKTTLVLPSGGEIGLYQPRHPTALHLGRPS